MSSKRRTSGLNSLRVRGEARGDGQRRVDERDLDVPIPLGAPLDERQGGEDPFGVGEVLSCGASFNRSSNGAVLVESHRGEVG